MRKLVALPDPRNQPETDAERERRTGDDRRRSRRLRFTLETAVPVMIREGSSLQWGLVRNVSDGGMLIEIVSPPTIGSRIEIEFHGVRGTADAPDNVTLHGEVRHHVAWNFGAPSRAGLHAIGVRFTSAPNPELLPPAGSPIH